MSSYSSLMMLLSKLAPQSLRSLVGALKDQDASLSQEFSNSSLQFDGGSYKP